MRFFVALALFVGLVAAVPRLASADCTSTNVSVSKATRSKATHTPSSFTFFVSREDCTDGDEFTFPFVLSNIGSNTFEVWVAPNSSTDCSDKTARDNSTGATKCKLVATNGAPVVNGKVIVKSSDIAGAIDSVSGCDFTGSGTAPIATNIYFMLIPSGGGSVDPANVCKWSDTSVDLVGPEPPTAPTAGIGDTIATISYTLSNNQQDVLGYQFFCDPPPAGGAGGAGGATSATTSATTAATTSATTGSGGAGGAGGGTTTSTTATTGSGTSSGTNGGAADCPSSVLVAGQIPDLAYQCGKTNGASGNATGLTNGVTYAIGVAGYDNLGNVGKLSTMVCVTPGPVDDFFTLYKDAGGKAGGCAIRRSDEPSRAGGPAGEGTGLGLGLGLLALAALRRRSTKAPRA